MNRKLLITAEFGYYYTITFQPLAAFTVNHHDGGYHNASTLDTITYNFLYVGYYATYVTVVCSCSSSFIVHNMYFFFFPSFFCLYIVRIVLSIVACSTRTTHLGSHHLLHRVRPQCSPPLHSSSPSPQRPMRGMCGHCVLTCHIDCISCCSSLRSS